MRGIPLTAMFGIFIRYFVVYSATVSGISAVSLVSSVSLLLTRRIVNYAHIVCARVGHVCHTN